MRCLARVVSIAGLVAGAVGLGACAGPASTVARADLLERLRTGTSPVVLDARTGGEFSRDHVPGARHVGFLRAGSRAEALGIPKDAPIVVYCEHGPRAVLARAELRGAGFGDVRTLEGHMSGWRAAGMPVERGGAAEPRAGEVAGPGSGTPRPAIPGVPPDRASPRR